jgi:hypothetical protein
MAENPIGFFLLLHRTDRTDSTCKILASNGAMQNHSIACAAVSIQGDVEVALAKSVHIFYKLPPRRDRDWWKLRALAVRHTLLNDLIDCLETGGSNRASNNSCRVS